VWGLLELNIRRRHRFSYQPTELCECRAFFRGVLSLFGIQMPGNCVPRGGGFIAPNSPVDSRGIKTTKTYYIMIFIRRKIMKKKKNSHICRRHSNNFLHQAGGLLLPRNSRIKFGDWFPPGHPTIKPD